MGYGAAAIAPAVAVPAAAAPSYPWQWWFSYDGGDVYTEWFETKEEAIEHARNSGGGLVAECQQQDFHLRVEGDTILEILDGQNEEAIGEGDGIECTSEQADDLGKTVSDAIEAWAQKHKINLTAWTFGGVRNKIEVPDTITKSSLNQ